MYRNGVGLLLVNKYGQVFVAKRIIEKKHENSQIITNPWQLPQGGIDEGEDEEATLFRETQEEIGILPSHFKILKKSAGYYKYELPQQMRPKFWDGKYIGQQQKWFCCLFTGNNNDINIETQDPEFESWKWVSPLSFIHLAVDFKKQMYLGLAEEFSSTINSAKSF